MQLLPSAEDLEQEVPSCKQPPLGHLGQGGGGGGGSGVFFWAADNTTTAASRMKSIVVKPGKTNIQFVYRHICRNVEIVQMIQIITNKVPETEVFMKEEWFFGSMGSPLSPEYPTK